MHYLSKILPALALAAFIDAGVVRNDLHRRHHNTDMMGAKMEPAGSPAAACNNAAPVNMVAPATAAPVDPASNASTASPGAAASGNATAAGGANAKAIYFTTNQDDNSVIMLPVQPDGTLAAGSIIATGGKGASLIDAMTGQPVQADTLASQGSLRVVGDSLFAVNAGSNTISMFAIDPQDPAKLTPVGQPVNTGGDFPTSIATSAALSIVCVAHTGALSGLTCAPFTPQDGITAAFDPLRPFDLKQTNPPTGPLNGIGTTFFNEASTALITTVKGDPATPAAFPGFISIFPVDPVARAVGITDTKQTPSGTAVLFGAVPIPGRATQILTTDASFGSATLDLANLTAPAGAAGAPAGASAAAAAPPVAVTKVEGQKATCWATVSRLTNTGFVTDVGQNRLVEVDLDTGEKIAEVASQGLNPGMLDLQAAGRMVYALAPGNGSSPASVAVFDVSQGRGRGKEVQNFVVQGLDNRGMGMAFHT